MRRDDELRFSAGDECQHVREQRQWPPGARLVMDCDRCIRTLVGSEPLLQLPVCVAIRDGDGRVR